MRNRQGFGRQPWHAEEGFEHGHDHPHRHGLHAHLHRWHMRHGAPWQHGPFRRPPAWFAPDHGWFDGPFGGRGPFGGDDFGGGGGRRQRRGDIKLALLELLAEQPRHGYELIKELEQRYGGFYRPSPGSVYPTLQLLEDEGHLVSEPIDGKRVYSITETGRQLLAEQQQRRSGPHGRREHSGPPSDLLELRRSMMTLQAGVMQVARIGTAAQRRAAIERLDAARREIYRILSEDDSQQVI